MSSHAPSPRRTADSVPVPAPSPADFGDDTPNSHEDHLVAEFLNDATVISFGIPLEDRQAKRFTIRVFVLAVAIAALSLVHFIANLLMGHYSDRGGTDGLWSALSGLLIELSIPASGYMGALYHNRQLTCCFCSCNLFLAILSVASFTRLVVRLVELKGNCEMEIDSNQRSLCEMWEDNGAHKYVFLTNLFFSATLSCCAFWAGNMLFQKLTPEQRQIDALPVVGEVVQLSANLPLSSVATSGATTPSAQVITLYSMDRPQSVSGGRSPWREPV